MKLLSSESDGFIESVVPKRREAKHSLRRRCVRTYACVCMCTCVHVCGHVCMCVCDGDTCDVRYSVAILQQEICTFKN